MYIEQFSEGQMEWIEEDVSQSGLKRYPLLAAADTGAEIRDSNGYRLREPDLTAESRYARHQCVFTVAPDPTRAGPQSEWQEWLRQGMDQYPGYYAEEVDYAFYQSSSDPPRYVVIVWSNDAEHPVLLPIEDRLNWEMSMRIFYGYSGSREQLLIEVATIAIVNGWDNPPDPRDRHI